LGEQRKSPTDASNHAIGPSDVSAAHGHDRFQVQANRGHGGGDHSGTQALVYVYL
jgi:hypothetical protein